MFREHMEFVDHLGNVEWSVRDDETDNYHSEHGAQTVLVDVAEGASWVSKDKFMG